MPLRMRALYSSANGDRWSLAADPGSERVFIRHEANVPSGGQVTDTEIGEFLARRPHGPEHQELLRMIRSLVDGSSQAEQSDA